MTHITRRRFLSALSIPWLGGCGGSAEEEPVPAITYSEFGGGLDRRLPIGVQDANRLWTLTNAYITSGKKIKKRPGLKVVAGGLFGSVGLSGLDGSPTVFAVAGSGFVPPAGVESIDLTLHAAGLYDVAYAEMFQGYPYVVGLYIDGGGNIVPRHSYVDGSPSTLITDVNCPHGLSVTKAASRIYATGGDVVRYSAAGDARDWTTASDAGFLPVGLQQDTGADCTAVGTFEDALVVMFPEGSQIWDVATDPSANQLRRRMYGAGTEHPLTLTSFYRDLVFASPYGVRSISVQENVERLDESDVGVPVDSLVVDKQRRTAVVSSDAVRGLWMQQLGQYWLIYRDALTPTSTVFAYSYSRTAKLAAWSVFTFPFEIKGACSVGGKVYVRDASTLYELDEQTYTDEIAGGSAIAVDVQMAYQDAKLPGVEKMFYGADFVFSGTAEVSYLYDPRDTSKETAAYSVTGDTRSTTVVPVEVSAAAIAPRFRHTADEAFEVSMLTLYFHSLSATAS